MACLEFEVAKSVSGRMKSKLRDGTFNESRDKELEEIKQTEAKLRDFRKNSTKPKLLETEKIQETPRKRMNK